MLGYLLLSSISQLLFKNKPKLSPLESMLIIAASKRLINFAG